MNMSKYLREFYEMDTIAVGEGLAVKKIEHDIEDHIYFVGFELDDMHKRTIQYDKDNKAYFTFNGIRRYLDNFLRVVNV